MGITSREDRSTSVHGSAISLAGHVQDGVGFVWVLLQRPDRLGSDRFNCLASVPFSEFWFYDQRFGQDLAVPHENLAVAVLRV